MLLAKPLWLWAVSNLFDYVLLPVGIIYEALMFVHTLLPARGWWSGLMGSLYLFFDLCKFYFLGVGGGDAPFLGITLEQSRTKAPFLGRGCPEGAGVVLASATSQHPLFYASLSITTPAPLGHPLLKKGAFS